MVVVYVIVIILYMLLFFISGRRIRRRKGEHAFDRAAACLYELFDKRKAFCSKGVAENLHMLNPETGGRAEREKNLLREFYIKKLRLVLLLVFIGDALALCLFINSHMQSLVEEGRYVNRNGYGKGSIEAALQAEAETETGTGTLRQDFTITVQEQRYEETMVRELAKEAAAVLPEVILNGNPSLEEVRSDLDLAGQIPGYPFLIDWESDDYSLIYSDGSVINEQLEETGKAVTLTAVFTYGDYREEHIFPVHILPPDYTEGELLQKKIYELLAAQEEKDRNKERLELPEKVGGTSLIWKERREDGSGALFLLICTAAVLVYLFQDRELEKKAEARNRQLLLDYPQLVGKLTLYMGAGMTIRNAFCRIASNYHRERQQGGGYHFVYEEMLLACHELESGISEAAAYEHFGRSCRLKQYTRLANLLVQNLKKGSSSVTEELRRETAEAFAERKNTARRMGEEAGTKLLFPMMIMLGIVMVLIIIPACFSFSL